MKIVVIIQNPFSLHFQPTCYAQNMVPGLFDPFGLSTGRTAEAKAKGRSSEIKNGRLAMIGVAGMWAAATLPGSVPLQPPC